MEYSGGGAITKGGTGTVITGVSSVPGGRDSLGCWGVKLISLPQRIKRVLPHPIIILSPFFTTIGERFHRIFFPRRKVVNTMISLWRISVWAFSQANPARTGSCPARILNSPTVLAPPGRTLSGYR